MSGTRHSWGTALVLYTAYRRTLRKTLGQHGNPTRALLVKIAVILLTVALVGPVLWHALLTMPTSLVVFIASALVFRVVRWFWRRS